MEFTQQNSFHEFNKLNECIEFTKENRKISEDEAETLTFFLEIVKEALMARVTGNS